MGVEDDGRSAVVGAVKVQTMCLDVDEPPWWPRGLLIHSPSLSQRALHSSAGAYCSRQSPLTSCRMTRAPGPAAIVWSGTSRCTTAPAATTAPAPTETRSRIVDPIPT